MAMYVVRQCVWPIPESPLYCQNQESDVERSEFVLAVMGMKSTVTLSTNERRRTLLLWLSWIFISAAFTIFNVFLPKLIQSNPEETYYDFFIYSLFSLPGPFVYFITNRRLPGF